MLAVDPLGLATTEDVPVRSHHRFLLDAPDHMRVGAMEEREDGAVRAPLFVAAWPGEPRIPIRCSRRGAVPPCGPQKDRRWARRVARRAASRPAAGGHDPDQSVHVFRRGSGWMVVEIAGDDD